MPEGDGKTVVRLNSGLFYARVPGLNLASSRSTNGSPGPERLPRELLQRLRRHPADVPEPAAGRGGPGDAGPPGHLRLRRGLPEPADLDQLRHRGAGGRAEPRRPRPVRLREGRAHHALLRAERHRLRLPVGHGPRGRRDERPRLRHQRGQRAGERRGDGQEPLPAASPSASPSASRGTTSSRRTTRCPGTSPTTTRSATRSPTATSGTTTSTPSTATPTATSATA